MVNEEKDKKEVEETKSNERIVKNKIVLLGRLNEFFLSEISI